MSGAAGATGIMAAQIAKAEGAITVVGGVHMAIFARETLSYDYIDYGVVGEGRKEEPHELSRNGHCT